MYTVIITSLVMTFGLIKYGDNGKETEESSEESSTELETINDTE